MATIPGASGYLNSAILANKQGLAAQSATVLGEGGIGAVSLLDVGRSSLFDSGVGLSARARLLNNQFLESTASTFNSIFSLNLGATASVEGLQQQILALRGKATRVSRDVAELTGQSTGSKVIDDAVAEELAAAEAAEASKSLSEDSSTVLAGGGSSSFVDTTA